MITTDALARPGRRDRNMQDKHGRIFQAAAALFEAHGYAGVTTQAISERADVGAGTLFRYASSKDELLLMVLNQALRAALAQGAARARGLRDPVDIAERKIAPMVQWVGLRAGSIAI